MFCRLVEAGQDRGAGRGRFQMVLRSPEKCEKKRPEGSETSGRSLRCGGLSSWSDYAGEDKNARMVMCWDRCAS